MPRAPKSSCKPTRDNSHGPPRPPIAHPSALTLSTPLSESYTHATPACHAPGGSFQVLLPPHSISFVDPVGYAVSGDDTPAADAASPAATLSYDGFSDAEKAAIDKTGSKQEFQAEVHPLAMHPRVPDASRQPGAVPRPAPDSSATPPRVEPRA